MDKSLNDWAINKAAEDFKAGVNFSIGMGEAANIYHNEIQRLDQEQRIDEMNSSMAELVNYFNF
mgnify:CR=1 FL=1